jgi:tetratricopeptide (TPR) repeat protein
VLIVQHEAESRAIQLRNGSPIAVASNRGAEALEDFLVRTKRISGAEHEALMERVEAGLGSPREILVGMGFLGEGELEAAIGERSAEPLLEGFGWSSGSYRFEAGKRLNPSQTLGLDRSPARLLFEGVLAWSPSDMIRELLRRRGPFYLSRVERPPHPLEDLAQTACTPAALESLLGTRSVTELLDSGEIEERVLYGLLVTRFVEVHPEPVLLLRDMHSPGPRAAREAARPSPPRSAPAEAKIEEAAAPDAVESAIAALRRLGRGTPDAEAGASRRLEAESWFRKGEVFLSRKLHADAVEAFGMAAHLDPAAGEYRAHLGYVLHLRNPRNELVRREALEHIARGIKLSPDRERPLLFLGRVFKAAGELENARKVFRRALEIKPDCQEAQSELRLLKLRTPKRRSLLDRLFRRGSSTRA